MEENQSEAEVNQGLEELKVIVKSYVQKANQRYSIEQAKLAIQRVEGINASITKNMPIQKRTEQEQALRGEEEYIGSLANRISDFQGQERDNLIATLMEARYRIQMGKLLLKDSTWEQDKICDFFKNVPEVEKILYGKFLIDDINSLITRYNQYCTSVEQLVAKEEKVQKDYQDADTIIITSKEAIDATDAKINEIQDEFYNDLMEDFQITGLFSKRGFMCRLAIAYTELNSITQKMEQDKINIEEQEQKAKKVQEEKEAQERKIKEEREKKERKSREEQERKRELEEKYKNMTDEEMQQEIAKIDSQVFDAKQKYQRIIEFQLAIAKARGLIGNKETLEGEDMAFLPCRTSELLSVIENLNKNVVMNTALIGVDDDRATSLIVVPKGEEARAKEIQKKQDESPKGYKTDGQDELIGKLNARTLELVKDYKFYFVIRRDSKNLYRIYTHSDDDAWARERCKEEMEKLYQQLHSEKLAGSTEKNIQFSIQLPLQRPIIPVLEQLKQAGIEFLIPTANISGFDFKKTEPTYRIYMDRKYLQNYKEMHQKLFKQGVFAVTDVELHLSDFLLFDCEFPYGIDKEEKQH